MGMFCYQCQETAGGKGCTLRGVCGKSENVAALQDLLIYTLKGIAERVVRNSLNAANYPQMNRAVITSLFMTITNANFDDEAINRQIDELLALRNALPLPDGAMTTVSP